MGDVPAQVFIDAAKVWARVFFPAEPDEVIAAHAPDIAATPNFRAAVASAYRAGQAATADGPRRWALPDGAEVEEQWTMRYVLNGRWQSAEDGGHVFDSVGAHRRDAGRRRAGSAHPRPSPSIEGDVD
jgi:hypothetical protein